MEFSISHFYWPGHRRFSRGKHGDCKTSWTNNADRRRSGSVTPCFTFSSRYAAHDRTQVIEAINQTGYGLTLGIQSRIQSIINTITRQVHVGNQYVNRSMIGAVVGVQPFGGEGLSGTGPKAGGPYYLPRLCVERTLSINTTAAGGNASLLCLEE